MLIYGATALTYGTALYFLGFEVLKEIESGLRTHVREQGNSLGEGISEAAGLDSKSKDRHMNKRPEYQDLCGFLKLLEDRSWLQWVDQKVGRKKTHDERSGLGSFVAPCAPWAVEKQ